MNSREKKLGVVFTCILSIIVLGMVFRAFNGGSDVSSTDPDALRSRLQAMESILESEDLWSERDLWLEENVPNHPSEAVASSKLLERISPIFKSHRLKVINQELTRKEDDSGNDDSSYQYFNHVSVLTIAEGELRDIVQCIHGIQTPQNLTGIDDLSLEIGESGAYRVTLLITHWFITY